MVPGNVWNLALHLLLTAVETFSAHAGCGGSAGNLEFVSLAYSAQETAHRKDGARRFTQIVGRDSALGSSPGDSHILIRAKKLPCVRDAVPLVRLEAEVVVQRIGLS
jgi:hypothetical protein